MIGVGVSVCTAAVLGGGGDAPSFALTITGLTGGEARPGDHASLGYTIDPDNGTETVAWGVSAGDSSYGTGASPSDFTAGDGGSLVLTVTDGGETRSVSAPIRYAAAVNTVAPVVSGGTSLGSTLTVANGTWTAAGGTYSRQWQRDGVNIAGQTGTTYDIVQADSGADIRCIVTYTNSGGAVSANSNAVTAQVFAAPIISGVPLISGTEQVGQTLTTTPASVTGNPTPSRTWQWERSGTPISGATSATYDLVAADEGETITVVQTETNALGADDAESAATGAIAAAPAAFVVTSMSLVDIGGGVGQLTLTFDAGETDGTPALVRGYIKEPASSPPADGAAVASGVGAAATFEIVSTVGGVINAEVPIIGDPISGLRDVFVAASKTIPYNPGSV